MEKTKQHIQRPLNRSYLCSLNLDFNLGQNICRLFNVLAKFLFTTSGMELDYYHQKVNVRIISQVAEQLKP